VRSGPRYCDEAAASQSQIACGFYVNQSGVEMNNLWSRGGEDVNGASIRMRMFAFHVHDALIFYRFEFG
jgi:hypothetical protein